MELTISDNGPGIDKEALLKWVVDYHGWSISVSSRVEPRTPDATSHSDSVEVTKKDEGTSFIITIPLTEGNK